MSTDKANSQRTAEYFLSKISVSEAQNIKVSIFAEVDDMAMLRLLTRDSGGVALAPAVVVQDELKAGTLQQYCVVPDLFENFYAITTERRFQPRVLKALLAQGSL